MSDATRRIKQSVDRANAMIKDGRLVVRQRERDVMTEIYTVLPLCSKIAKVWRQNNGAAYMDNGQWVVFGEAGIPDFIGFLKDGRFFAIEAKRPGERPTAEQALFLSMLNDAGGVGIVAFKAEDVLDAFR